MTASIKALRSASLIILSRHAALSLHTCAGMSSANNRRLTLISTVPFDPSTLYQPTNDFYDNRDDLHDHAGLLTIQKSTRLSYSFGADGILDPPPIHRPVRRGWRGRSRRPAVPGLRGAPPSARHTTIPISLSTASSAAPMFTPCRARYARPLTRSTEFSGMAGVARYETKFVQTVAVDPAIAALIGISSANARLRTAAP